MAQSKGASIFGGRFVLKVSRDRMEAHLIAKDDLGLKAVDMDQLMREVRESGVAYGLLGEPEDLGGHVYAVARGKKPVNGENGRIVMHVPASVVKKPKIDPETGAADFRSLGAIVNVNRGRLLMEKVPPTPGEPGMNVLGEEIPPKPGKDCKLAKGPGIELDEDGMRAVAAINGKFMMVDGRPGVYAEHIHSGDVDVESGNLIFGGSRLEIKGEVLPGFEVKCRGNVKIGRGVNNGLVMAGGTVEIGGGIVGEEAVIRAIGDISIEFAENGPVFETRGNLHVRDYLLQCRARVAGDVTGPEKGAIIGGETVAGGSVHIFDLGSDAEVVTDITVGMKPDLAARKAQLDEELPLWSGRLNETIKTVTGLQKMQKEKGSDFPADKLEKLKKYNAAIPRLMERVEKLQAMMTALEEELDQAVDASVFVHGTVYPGVTVRIGPAIRTLTAAERGVVIHFDRTSRQIHVRPMTGEEKAAAS